MAAGEDTEDKRVKLFVHGKRHVEPIRFRNWREAAPPYRLTVFQQDTYDRYVRVCIPQTTKTCPFFTKSPQASAVLFRYCACLPPANPVVPTQRAHQRSDGRRKIVSGYRGATHSSFNDSTLWVWKFEVASM